MFSRILLFGYFLRVFYKVKCFNSNQNTATSANVTVSIKKNDNTLQPLKRKIGEKNGSVDTGFVKTC